MSLDPATILGFAIGEAGACPRSGSIRLKRPSDDRDVAPFNALCFLRDTWTLEKPDIVCVEHFLNPVAQKSADAVILQIEVYGVIVAMCRAYGIRYEAPQAATVRLHFCGRARMGVRAETKRMVIQRAITLGYLPRGCRDDDRADACALFDYASAHYGRVTPASLVMFGEGARA